MEAWRGMRHEARQLREVRRRNLYTIDGLAGKAGVSTKTIVDIEKGRNVPRLKTIKKISEALEIDPMQIVEFADAIEEEAPRTGKRAA